MSDPQWWLLDDLVLARSAIDRAAERRSDQAWVEGARIDPSSRFVRVHQGTAAIDGDRLALDASVPEHVPTSLLGIDDDGVAYFCAHYDEAPALADSHQWADLRMSGSRLDAMDAGLMVASVALDNWSRNHRHCPQCGGGLSWRDAGWSRHCSVDDSSHFPRTDPAVIVLVRDDDDRALLGRQRIGTRPEDLQYLGSQPWPFPASLMLGYHAFAADPSIAVDGEEIAEARWLSRAELARACATGEVSLPPAVSIARKLIERWYGEPLPGDWSRPLTKPSR